MKIMVFTEGTILMHKNGIGHSRKEIVQQVKEKEQSVKDYTSYVPIGNCVKKLLSWKRQGFDIIYLTSRKNPSEIKAIAKVLNNYNFPQGRLVSRKSGEEYKDVAERELPSILIEDDVESGGEGEEQMVYNNVKKSLKSKIRHIVIKEFSGIDKLPEDVQRLRTK